LALLILLLGPVLANPSADLSRAETLLREGRPEQVLQLVTGGSLPDGIVRVEALLELERYTEAITLLDGLGSQPAATPPWDFRLQIVRGRCLSVRQDLDAAERFYRQAVRLASSPEQKVEAWDRLVALYDSRELWEKAQEIQSAMEDSVVSLKGYALADHLSNVGKFQQNRGRRSEAMTAFAGSRAIYESLDLPIRAADTAFAMAIDVAQGGDRERAWAMVGEVLDLQIQAQAWDRVVGTMETLSGLGTVASKVDQTLALLEKASKALPAGRWRDRARLMTARYDYNMKGDSDKALALFKGFEQRTDLDPGNRLSVLYALSMVAGANGKLEEAKSYLDQAMASASPRFYNEQHSSGARGPVLYARARLERQELQFGEALKTLHQAIAAQPEPDWAFWRTTVRYDCLLTTLATYDLEAARQEFRMGLKDVLELESTGRKVGGVTRLLAALAINQSLAEDLLDPGAKAMAGYDTLSRTLLTEMLAPEGSLGRYLELYQRWVQQSRDHGDLASEVSALIYQAVFMEAAGREAEALALVREGLDLAIRKQLLLEAAIGYLVQARLEDSAGRIPEAMDSLKRLAEVSSRMQVQAAHFYHLVLASYQLRHGQAREALATYQASIDYLPERAWQGLYGQARALESMGEPAAALASLDKALASPEIASRSVSKATILSARARLLLLAGRREEALESFAGSFPALLGNGQDDVLVPAALAYSQALVDDDRAPEGLAQAQAGLDTLIKRGTASPRTLQPLFERVVQLSLGAGRQDEALRYLELSRSADLVSSVKLSQVETGDPATQALLQDLDGLKQRLQGLQREADQTEQGPRREGLDKVLASTREQFFSKIDQLKRDEPDFEALVQLSGSSLSVIQSSLDKESALLEFFPSEETLYLFVVTADNLRLYQVLVSRQKLAEMVERYVELARDPDSDPRALAESSHLLYDLLLKPALAGLGERSKLRLVPAGSLWSLPFEALLDSEKRSLDERFEVSMLTSADLLRTLAARPQERTLRSVLLGAPDGRDLPGARAELDALARLLPASSLLAGAKATSGALRSSATDAGILHIASHSGAGGGQGQCYISLADGPFPLEKIYGLSLSRGALVVLSSCRSALGESDPGREVTSLASAFNIAGASTVIASHWEVDDEVTQRLFVSFYRHLLAGNPRGQALRLARQELARTNPHPYYWAAFSLFGSPD
jgi:CHAT domain-containing protein